MAVIHNTTMNPTKLELLASWLPAQPWYVDAGREPELSKAGGFRLDDPRGEVGIEFMVVTDESGAQPVSYHVPLTYRGAPLDAADHALIGTSVHGVLGQRWIYDGTHDPVLHAQLLALLQGHAEPQAQSVTNAPDPTVTVTAAVIADATTATTVRLTGADLPSVVGSAAVPHGPYFPRLTTGTETEAGLTILVTRVLQADRLTRSAPAAEARGYVTAGWITPDGGKYR